MGSHCVTQEVATHRLRTTRKSRTEALSRRGLLSVTPLSALPLPRAQAALTEGTAVLQPSTQQVPSQNQDGEVWLISSQSRVLHLRGKSRLQTSGSRASFKSFRFSESPFLWVCTQKHSRTGCFIVFPLWSDGIITGGGAEATKRKLKLSSLIRFFSK